MRTQQGIVFAPYVDGEVNPKGYEGASEEETKVLQERLSGLQAGLGTSCRDFPRWERARRQEQMELHRDIVAEGRARTLGICACGGDRRAEALKHLDKVRKDIKATSSPCWAKENRKRRRGRPSRSRSAPSAASGAMRSTS